MTPKDSIVPSGTPDNAASGDNQVISSDKENKTVAYSSHQKLLGEKRRMQDRLEELEGKFNTLNESNMVTEGKKDELIESLRARGDDFEQKYKGAVVSFGTSSINAAFEIEARNMGCVDSSMMLMAMEKEFKSLETDEGFKPNQEQVKTLLETLRTNKPFLFQTEKPNINDGKIVTGDLTIQDEFLVELKKCRTQIELDTVRKKYGRE